VKYVPLIWSALWRKPEDAVLTGLAITVAFALFGLMLGVNATLRVEGRLEIIWDAVFTLSVRRRIHRACRRQEGLAWP
jgi:hypothetical protein